MKNLIFLFLSFPCLIYAQWVQGNTGTISDFYAVEFVRQDLGWISYYDGGIMRTTDGGVTWQDSLLPVGTFSDIQFIWYGYKGFASQMGDNLLFTTRDSGLTWDEFTVPNLINLTSVSFVDTNLGIVTSTGNSQGHIARTTDGGETWTTTLSASSGIFDAYFPGEGWAVGRVDDTGNNGKIYKSTDIGLTWMEIYPPGEELYSVFFVTYQYGWAVGRNNTIIKTTDGGNSWVQQYGPPGYDYKSCYFSDINTGWIVGGNSDTRIILKTIDGGSTWFIQDLQTGNGILYDVCFLNDQVGWAVGKNGQFLLTTNGGGNTFLQLTSPNGGENWQYLNTVQISWSSNEIALVRLELSTNNGLSWVILKDSLSAITGNYTLPVPLITPPSNECKIKITSINPGGFEDESNNVFSIFAEVSSLAFDPNAGTYNNSQTVFITCQTDSVDIFYTLDGSDPTQSSILYTGPLYLNSSVTLKAKAYKDGWIESDIKSGVYNFAIAGLNFQPPQGTYSTPQVVTISTISDSVDIYYTIDGSEPTQNSTHYTQPVNIDSSQLLKARAFRNGWISSDVKSGNYVISDQVINIVINTEPIWYDNDYNGFETRFVDGSGTTITYGNITLFEWLIDGVIVETGSIADIQLSSGTKFLTLRATSNLGIIEQDSVGISVYVASMVTNGPITSAVGQLSENIFFASSTDDRVYRFDSTGSVNWTILTGGDIQSTICIGNQNNIYVGSSDTRLYAFDSEGTPKWDRAMGGVIISSPSISNDSMVYVGVSTGRLFAVTESGSIQWNFQTGGAIYSSPSVSVNGDILVGSDDGKLYSVSKDGNFNWSFTTVAPIQSSPAIGNDSTIVFGSNDGSVYKLNHLGGLVWSYDAGGAVKSSPVIDNNGQIYFGSENGKIICLTSGGNLVWEYNAGGSIDGSPALAPDGSVIVGNSNGKLLVISQSGEALWYLQTQAAVKSPVLYTDNDLVIFGQNSGNIYIIKYPTSGKYLQGLFSTAEWPTFKGSNKRTGNKLGLITDVDKNNIPLPKESSLIQNFPNPFNPSTKIKYSVLQTSQVQIKVFGALGNEIETLVNEEKPAGTYEVKWNAVNLPSGVYFYQLRAGDFIQTKKMILLK